MEYRVTLRHAGGLTSFNRWPLGNNPLTSRVSLGMKTWDDWTKVIAYVIEEDRPANESPRP